MLFTTNNYATITSLNEIKLDTVQNSCFRCQQKFNE